jgi:hypothetical protein
MNTHTREQLIEFIEQLFMEVYHTNSKLELSMYIHNKFVDCQEVSEIAPSFFVLTMDSLANDIIIRFAKLFDGGSSYGNLFKLLNLIEVNFDLFPKEKKLILSEVSTHRKMFKEDNNELLQNLKTWRDKNYAHWDKIYFFDADRPKLGEDSPILYGQLLTLLQTSADVINYYSKMLYRTHHSLKNPQITNDVDALFEALSVNITKQH